MGARVQRVQRVMEKVLRIDRPLAGGFLGLTGLRPEGCGIAYGATAWQGSEGSEGSARFQRAGSKGVVSPFWAMSFIISLREMKTIQPPTGVKNRQTGPAARWKCTPSAYGTSPGGGGLLSAYPCDNLSCSIYRRWKTSPFGGSTSEGGDRGAFPSRQRRGCMVFPARRAVVWFY